jgi:hypothetical protein
MTDCIPAMPGTIARQRSDEADTTSENQLLLDLRDVLESPNLTGYDQIRDILLAVTTDPDATMRLTDLMQTATSPSATDHNEAMGDYIENRLARVPD